MYDKYDPHYRWRRKLAGPPAQASIKREIGIGAGCAASVGLFECHENRAQLRRNFARAEISSGARPRVGAVSPVPANVETARLASFAAKSATGVNCRNLKPAGNRWSSRSQEHPEFKLPVQLGILKKGPRWLRWGITVRDAWIRVFETRPVVGCLSADDSNPYTRIPLLLAEQRGIPAVACHHGALDCRMAFKNLRFSNYLAKGEMERDYLERICGVDARRIRIGAASSPLRENAQSGLNALPGSRFSLSRMKRIYGGWRRFIARCCRAFVRLPESRARPWF